MRRHGESAHKLWRAIVTGNDRLDPATLVSWRRGRRSPRSLKSFVYLERIEDRYTLPRGYFRSKLPHRARAASRASPVVVSPAEQRRLAWHLPDDFETREPQDQKRIIEWIRTTIVSGATDFRRFQSAALKFRYGLRFPRAMSDPHWRRTSSTDAEPDGGAGSLRAPRPLVEEMKALIHFKTETLTPPGYARRGVWGEETAAQKLEHLSLMFGALAASPSGPVKGHGVSFTRITLALLIFPQVWDWYIAWREQRRGFYTAWEVDMLSVAASLCSAEVGWLRQTPALAARLKPVRGLITDEEIARARQSWGDACDRMHAHAIVRSREVARIARVHRDPFEAILPVLEAPSPLAEYRKIADEIIRLMPDEQLYPKAAAEARRALLMIRLGLHLGLRQRNLRELMLCRRGQSPATDRQLADLRRGELRWTDRENGWEVYIPAIAFKNAHSTFFAGQPFRLLLPDLAGLYACISRYIETDRGILLGGAPDPGVFFIKSTKSSSTSGAYDQNTFYEAWRLITQRYGVYNPWTGRGAIAGLLPHGPHNVRDVLATHILKQTGSFEQASYAIQDTPDIVARHYGRFLPENKAALAARILNKVWEE